MKRISFFARRTSLIGLVIFYLFAGSYHFINPSFYLPLIPPYLSAWATEINVLSGFLEMLFAVLLIPKRTRSWAGTGIIILLIAFIPSHIYFIQKGIFQLGPYTVTPLIGWLRLLVIHPLLILWAWFASRN
jgi:uncharacterized membrane protein